MSADRLPDLFAQALELDPAGRHALVREVATEDAALARELERLLLAESETSPLDRSPWGAVGAPIGLEGEAASDEPPPERIGPYRILRELGRGGMGRVFLAEEEAEDFRRTVALKVIYRPGFDEQAIRRFRDEVRILASLEHPGIARFLGGGRAPDGTWFLALEHVEGEDLIRYAAGRQLSVPERIRLALDVLDAVQFAHERGVVHRDLKPGHLLIGRDGRPRLLDFGISKLVDPQSGESLALTRTEARAMTPAYASPEQFRGERVTGASDVYSFGVLLYELLAGERPFAAVDSPVALAMAVLETDPEPPSTAARRAADERARGGDATGRNVRPGPHGRELSRDLDEICLKALRKRPEERYASAAALAADLRRYLEGRPVEARRGGRRYRLVRFVQRNRGRLGTATALAIAAVATMLAATARRPVADNRPAAVSLPAPPIAWPFSNIGSADVEALERRFAAEPASVETGASLALALKNGGRLEEAGLVVGRLRQIPGKREDPLTDYVEGTIAADLDQPQRALVLLTRSRDRAIAERRSELIAQVRATRGRLLSTMGHRDEARSEMELARADFERLGDHASLARVLNDLAIERLELGDLDRGEALLERAASETRAAGKHPLVILGNLAAVKVERGRPDLAEPMFREALELRKKSPNPGREGEVLTDLAAVVRDLGRPAEAVPIAARAIERLREAGRQIQLSGALFDRGAVDVEGARLDRVASTVAEIEEAARVAGSKECLAYARGLRALSAAAAGDLAAARRDFAGGRKMFLDSGYVEVASQLDVTSATVEESMGDARAVLPLVDGALARLAAGGTGTQTHFFAEILRARIEAKSGRTEQARRRLLALGESNARSPSLSRRSAVLAARAELARAEGRFDDARRNLQSALQAASDMDDKLDGLRLRLDLAEVEREAGKVAVAAEIGHAVAGEAERLGLYAIARRAKGLAVGGRVVGPSGS